MVRLALLVLSISLFARSEAIVVQATPTPRPGIQIFNDDVFKLSTDEWNKPADPRQRPTIPPYKIRDNDAQRKQWKSDCAGAENPSICFQERQKRALDAVDEEIRSQQEKKSAPLKTYPTPEMESDEGEKDND